MDLTTYLEDKKKLVEDALIGILDAGERRPQPVRESMRYSVCAGGKRMRPVLCLAAVEALGKNPISAMPAACALELIHTYSLIHDDLPCMDDDDLRRGKPTNHRVFGEAVALLAGDALIAKAFEVVAGMEAASASLRVEMVVALARCAGAEGLVGGQALDLASEGREVSGETVDYIHSRKTAALIETSVLFGAMYGGASRAQRQALCNYGRSLGMAFQITDDILDAEGDESRMGKRPGQDKRARKATYPALYGVEESREIAGRYISSAREAIASFDQRADPLREIARSIVRRRR